MKNITVSLEDELYREARVAAAQAGTSVTALVREFLTALTGRDSATASPGCQAAILETIQRIRKQHPDFDPGIRLSRDEVHSRS